MRGAAFALLCVALVLLGELHTVAAGLRIPLRKVDGVGRRSARGEVPQPLTLNTQGFVMDVLLGNNSRSPPSLHRPA